MVKIKPELSSYFRGNFKMNGSIKMIKEIIEQINNAKLDDNTGTPLSHLSSCSC